MQLKLMLIKPDFEGTEFWYVGSESEPGYLVTRFYPDILLPDSILGTEYLITYQQ